MNLYKKFIPKKMRFTILRALKFIPDEQMIKMQYAIKLRRKLNLKTPQRYTEKIQWYKLNYRNEKMPICVDKYRVREYIKEKGLDNILVDLYGIYDRPEDIDFSKLPEKYIIKTTNGSGTNIICKNKNLINEIEIRSRLKSFLKQSQSHRSIKQLQSDPIKMDAHNHFCLHLIS